MTPLRRTGWAAVVVAAAVLAYANSVAGEFVWDDAYTIVDNPAIRSLANVPSFFALPWGAGAVDGGDRAINSNYWRPLALLSFSLDHALFGLAPAGFHAVNVLLHALASLLVLALGLRLVRDRPRAWPGVLAAALLFAVHPVHTEVVDVVSYRMDLLAGLFLLAGLVVWLGPRERSARSGWWVCCLGMPLLYAAGLASKEMAVTLPASVALLDVLGFTGRRAWWRVLLRVAPLLLVLAGYLWLRGRLLSPSPFSYFGDTPGLHVAYTMLGVFGLYVRLLVAPWPLNPWYDWSVLPPETSPFGVPVLLGAGLLLAWVAAVIATWRRAPVVAFGLAFFCVTLLPVSQVVDVVVAAGERFLYAASAGPLLAFGVAVATLARLEPVRRTVWVAVGVLGLLFVGLTVVRNADWSSDRTVLEAKVRDWPRSYTAWVDLAMRYELEGDTQKAEALFEKLGGRPGGDAASEPAGCPAGTVRGRAGYCSPAAAAPATDR